MGDKENTGEVNTENFVSIITPCWKKVDMGKFRSLTSGEQAETIVEILNMLDVKVDINTTKDLSYNLKSCLVDA